MANILIIDDESNIRLMLRLALTHSGHTADTAGDGYEGLDKFGPTGAGWDLVLLDQRMPGMEGLEVLREMRSRRADVRIILITAFGTIDLATEAMRDGARDFLRKPFTMEILNGAVEAALRGDAPPQGTDRHPGVPPLSFDLTAVNGYHIASLPDLRKEGDGSIEDEFIVHDPYGGERRCRVVLPAYLIELVKAHADRETLPGGDRFWQALCGEALANYLWQNAELPADDILSVEDLTSGLRHWIEAVLLQSDQAGGLAAAAR